MTTAASALVKIAANEFAAADFAGALALADPLVRWDDRALEPDTELVWGRDEVLVHLGQWLDRWEAYGATVVELHEVGDRTVFVYDEEGIERSTGIHSKQRRAAVVTVERGAIVGWARYLSESEAERAASAGEVTRF